MRVTFRGTELPGCVGVTRLHQNPRTTVKYGADGHATETRHHDVGDLVVQFDAVTAEGARYLATIAAQEEGPMGRLTVEGEAGEIDVDSDCWTERGDPLRWVFSGVTMPR